MAEMCGEGHRKRKKASSKKFSYTQKEAKEARARKLTAYAVFTKEQYQKNKFPDFKQAAKQIASKWKGLSETEKCAYDAKGARPSTNMEASIKKKILRAEKKKRKLTSTRGPSAYALFIKSHASEFKKGRPLSEVSKELAAKWRKTHAPPPAKKRCV